MLFIGFPITYATAAKLIGLHPNTNHEVIEDHYGKIQICLRYIYQETCALGISVYELTVPSGPFQEYDEGLEVIMSYKRSLMSRLQKANINIDSLEIVPCRDQPAIIKHNPQPYLIII